jgi:hypothetical protein
MLNGLMFEQVPITQSELATRAVVDAVVISCTTLLTLLALLKLGTRPLLIAFALMNVSLALAAGVSVIRDRDELRASATTIATGGGGEQPIRFSRGKPNVLVLFLDRFMGGFVESILKEEPQLREALDGFSWYPLTLAPGENSIAGLHPLLGGYDYTPREMNRRNLPLRDLSVESYSLLPYNFTRKGYAANLVSPRGLGFTVEGDCRFVSHIKGLTCTHIPLTVTKRLAERHKVPMKALADSLYADLLVLLGLMRGMPYVLREVLHARGPWRPYLDHSAGTTFKQWAELKSLPVLTSVSAEQSNLNIVFNMLPHEPYFMGEDCMPRSSMLEAPEDAKDRGHVSLFSFQHYVAARCSLLIVADYFEWMRKQGVYDNTKIVIVSDHGIVGSVEDRSSRAVKGGTTHNVFVRSRSVLFVKERDAKGPLKTSKKFVPNAEVPRIVCEEIGGCTNPYLDGNTIEAHGRDLPFSVDFVPWQFSRQEPRRFKIKAQMVLEGPDPYKAKNWREMQSK